MERPSDQELVERAAALLRAPVPLARDFERRVMSRVRSAGAPGRSFGGWMTTSRAVTVRLRPVWVLAAAAVLVATVLGPRIFRGPSLMPSPAENQAVVTFVAPFPTAHTVAVAGSFSGWSPIPLERTGGVFQARIAVEVGVHEYMFVLDGDRWLPDPLAESSVDDGFGRRNSVLVAKRNGV